MARALGMADFLGKKFDTFKFEGRWAAMLGEPEKNFKMCIWGASGNGKTDFCVQFSKYLTQFGKVYYNSFEEGVSKSLQAAFNRHDMMDVKGKIIVGDRETFPEVMQRLRQRIPLSRQAGKLLTLRLDQVCPLALQGFDLSL
jgi:hypothetical protein